MAISFVAAILLGMISAGGGALSEALNADWPGSVAGGLSSLVMFGTFVGAVVALFLPKWRPIGAGILATMALGAILAGAACVVLLASLSSMN